MSTGSKQSSQAPKQSGPGTSVPKGSLDKSSGPALGPAGNSTSGTNQGSSRGKQG